MSDNPIDDFGTEIPSQQSGLKGKLGAHYYDGNGKSHVREKPKKASTEELLAKWQPIFDNPGSMDDAIIIEGQSHTPIEAIAAHEGDVDDFGGDVTPKDFSQIVYAAFSVNSETPLLTAEERRLFTRVANAVLSQSESNYWLGEMLDCYARHAHAIARNMPTVKRARDAYEREKNLK